MMRYREPRTCATLPTVILNSEGVLTVEKKKRKIGGIYYVTEEVLFFFSGVTFLLLKVIFLLLKVTFLLLKEKK